MGPQQSCAVVEEHVPGGVGERKRRLYLVDDHPILRESLRELINLESDLEVCGGQDSASEALEEIDKLHPDLVVMDIELKEASGIELIGTIKTLVPQLPVLAFSVHDESLYADRALRAGAQGYLMKQAPLEEVLEAIRKVLGGEAYLSDRMRERGRDSFSGSASGLEQLSERELQVFTMIGDGLGTRGIAEKLGLSVKTIETYRAHIREKLKLQDGMELVRYALKRADW